MYYNKHLFILTFTGEVNYENNINAKLNKQAIT
jgi:hypothetical protein